MKILALDIGSAQVKAVVVDTKFRRFDINYHNIAAVSDALEPIHVDQEPISPGQIQAVHQILTTIPSTVDRIAINLPMNNTSSRIMNFPFKDRKKIRSAIQFQIEDEIPFSVDDCIYSFQIFAKQNKNVSVLNNIAPKEYLVNYLNVLEKVNVDPDYITPDQSSYGDFIIRQKNIFANKNILIIDLGHRKCSMYFFHKGTPSFQKTTMIGGYHVTKAIAENYGINLAEAEVAKLDRGFIAIQGTPLDENQKKFSDVILAVFSPFFHDLNQGQMAFTSRNKEYIDEIYLCGGTSSLPGLLESIAEKWKQPVSFLNVSSSLPNISLNLSQNSESLMTSAICLGLTQTSGFAGNSMNLRTGDIRKTAQAIAIPWALLSYPIKLVATVYIFAVLSFAAQRIIYQEQIKTRKRVLTKTAKRVLSGSPSFIRSITSSKIKLKKRADKEVTKLKNQLSGPMESIGPKFSILKIINSLSKTVPRSAIMEIKRSQFSSEKVVLDIESPNKQSANQALESMKKDPTVASLTNTDFVEKKGKVTFKVTITPKPQSDG